MRLTTEQIQTIATGVLDVREDAEGVYLLRTTAAQRAVYGEEERGGERALTMAGITLDFRTDSERLTLACSGIRLSPNFHCAFDVLIDGEYYSSFSVASQRPEGERTGESAFRHTFRFPAGEKRVTLYFPLYALRVDAVELDDGASLTPCRHSCKWLAFGDSITEGREPDHPSNSYVCRLARMLDAEVYNQGISGEMFRSRKIVPGTYPACDFVTVAYGTNDFRKQAEELLAVEVDAFFQQLTAAFPDVPVFYLLPLWRKDKDRVTRGRTLEEVCGILRQKAEKYPGITVIDCWNFVPPREELFFDRRLHPNDEGSAFYANALCRELLKHLPVK